MKKKILKLVLGSSVGMVAMGLIIIIPCLMLMDFFGANVTDGFVENNVRACHNGSNRNDFDIIYRQIEIWKGE